MEQGLTGDLLVASPAMGDWFRRAVVLVVEHNDDGAFGLALNRPSDATLAEASPELSEAIASDGVVHVGGPVSPTAVTALGEHLDPAESSKLVVGAAGMVDLENPPPLERVRIFAGYAGWSAGQLDEEIESEAWITDTARIDDLFHDEEDAGGDLWSMVLRRKGGEYRLLAQMPADPSLN